METPETEAVFLARMEASGTKHQVVMRCKPRYSEDERRQWGQLTEVEALPRKGEQFDYDRHGPQKKWFKVPQPTCEEEEKQSTSTYLPEFTKYKLKNPQARVKDLIPKSGLMIPQTWFENDEDAEFFVHTIAQRGHIAVTELGRTRTANNIIFFLDQAYEPKNRRILEEKHQDHLHLGLGSRLFRYWHNIADPTCTGLGSQLGPRRSRHLILQLVRAHGRFTAMGEEKKHSELTKRIRKMRDWLILNCPAEIESFEDEQDRLEGLQPATSHQSKSSRVKQIARRKEKHTSRREERRERKAAQRANMGETRPRAPLPHPVRGGQRIRCVDRRKQEI